jgi:hypothetical protein
MGQFNTRATLITDEGEVDINASLWSRRNPGGLGEWGGTATMPVADAPLTNSGQATIRMPDGREGTVLITSTRMGSESPLARLELTGSGKPPF